jgi:hypothetical protein
MGRSPGELTLTSMRRETVIETPFASLWYYPAERIVHHQIHKFIYGAAFRELLMKGAEVLEANGATKWVSDDRNNGALPSEDKAWADASWQPLVIGSGWKTWAIVQPEKIVGQMNIRRIIRENALHNLEVQLFTSPEEALSWIVTR